MISGNKLKIFVSAILITNAVFIAFANKGKSSAEIVTGEKRIVDVAVEKALDAKSSRNKLKYPGTIVGEQEIKIVSQVSGIANYVGFDLGDQVPVGKILVKVDDQGSILGAGSNNFKSAQVQQLELALRQSKESLGQSKDNYKSSKTDANKTAKDIAKLQYESAAIGLQNAMNTRTITAPISGTVTARQVSMGDAISAGQTLATISRTNRVKVQFFLSAQEISNVSLGSQVRIEQGDREVLAKIINISPQADVATKRFLVEAMPDTTNGLLPGSVVGVWVETSQVVENDFLILPLAALSNTQTDNFIFIVENGLAKKISVLIVKISGEMAIIKTDIPDASEIIIEGNKLLQDGDKIQIK